MTSHLFCRCSKFFLWWMGRLSHLLQLSFLQWNSYLPQHTYIWFRWTLCSFCFSTSCCLNLLNSWFNARFFWLSCIIYWKLCKCVILVLAFVSTLLLLYYTHLAELPFQVIKLLILLELMLLKILAFLFSAAFLGFVIAGLYSNKTIYFLFVFRFWIIYCEPNCCFNKLLPFVFFLFFYMLIFMLLLL